ncbi:MULTISPECIES: hypothetical protein [unclassified Pasteurella]|uniref:hypothetical protein n=1 Tax=unclassified Pasteurella TaxID=2621516 RepID=UPI0010737152|nr:hypothetical protein [Pasteurella sp. 19428wF3_WM03]TFU52565.1 hypothetical protein E4T92_03520 [Pasteurella sp. WM03]
MPLPFILAGAAIVSGVYGVKKGFDAKSDLDDAERYQRYAKEESNDINKKLESQRSNTNSALVSYGNSKKQGIDQINKFDSLICYPNGERRNKQLSVAFNKKVIITPKEEVQILKDLEIIDKHKSLEDSIKLVKTQTINMEKMTSAVQSVAAGTIAGLAAGGASYLGVGTLAAASTGTAISTLSGAAATNATLAWLGGGSIASGGLGIAGGTAVLGGLVAGPLLAIGGAVMASKAAAKKDEAYEHLSKVRGEIKKLEIAISKLNAICIYTKECNSTFKELMNYWLDDLFVKFDNLASRGVHYSDLSKSDKDIVMANYKIAYLLRDFISEPVMKDDNVISKEEQKALKKAKKDYTFQ